MKRLITIHLLFAILLAACGPSAAATLQPLAASTNEAEATPPASETLAPTQTPEAEPSTTPTPRPTFGPTPTATLLPELILPSPAPSEPVFDVWDGLPTYLADSRPGFYFRLRYNTRVWAQTTDNYGQPALGHRDIPYCVIAPNLTGGLAPGLQVEHDMRKIGELFFEINIALQQGARQFVTYQASDGVIFTSFQVDFEEQPDDCIAAAEIVLATLTSVSQSQATPPP
ncbi:MAG: hypothetical protein HFACDABA_03235 [Anaerolineales bacterium]|nr:hypothetical protein [Anaerolineales bacterium]